MALSGEVKALGTHGSVLTEGLTHMYCSNPSAWEAARREKERRELGPNWLL